MNNIPIKALEIPQWWKEIRKIENEYSKELAELLKSTKEEVMEVKKEMREMSSVERDLKKLEFALKIAKRFKEKNLELSEEDKMKNVCLGRILKGLNDYKWARFRLENINNNFGDADHLFYNEDKGIIEIKED